MSEYDNVASQAQQHSHGEQSLKRCDFRRLRKTGSDCANVACCSRLLQTWAAATRKARSPTVDNRVRRMTSDDDEAERSRRRASKFAGSRSSSARYDGASCFLSTLDKENELVVNPISRLQPMKFVNERSDGVVPRRREHQPGSRVHQSSWRRLSWYIGIPARVYGCSQN